ncbi:hypothetical protein [Streptomyces sp. NPDC004284]|uniref:hypothetical protein n=1 Tax=Streptomyces sp. NPDC004284 TaxID=3364695 RepID=UPI0036924177
MGQRRGRHRHRRRRHPDLDLTYDADGPVATEESPGGYTLAQTEDPTGTAVRRACTRDSDGTMVVSDTVTEFVREQTTSHAGWSHQT